MTAIPLFKALQPMPTARAPAHLCLVKAPAHGKTNGQACAHASTRSTASDDLPVDSVECGHVLTDTDWRKRIQIKWDAVDETKSTVRMDTVVPADPPLVTSRRGRWRLTTTGTQRVFREAYQFDLLSPKVNDAIREQRGRGILVKDVRDAQSLPPLAAAAWHLSRDLTEPPLVTALAPRVYPQDQTVIAEIDFAVVLLLDTLLYVAAEHRRWALGRLATAGKQRERAEARLGVVLVDVQHRGALHQYLSERLPGHVAVHAQVPSGVARVRVSA